MVQLLLEKGANPGNDEGYRTPFEAAAYSGSVEIAELLLADGRTQATLNWGKALENAVTRCHPRMFKWILKRLENLNDHQGEIEKAVEKLLVDRTSFEMEENRENIAEIFAVLAQRDIRLACLRFDHNTECFMGGGSDVEFDENLAEKLSIFNDPAFLVLYVEKLVQCRAELDETLVEAFDHVGLPRVLVPPTREYMLFGANKAKPVEEDDSLDEAKHLGDDGATPLAQVGRFGGSDGGTALAEVEEFSDDAPVPLHESNVSEAKMSDSATDTSSTPVAVSVSAASFVTSASSATNASVSSASTLPLSPRKSSFFEEQRRLSNTRDGAVASASNVAGEMPGAGHDAETMPSVEFGKQKGS